MEVPWLTRKDCLWRDLPAFELCSKGHDEGHRTIYGRTRHLRRARLQSRPHCEVGSEAGGGECMIGEFRTITFVPTVAFEQDRQAELVRILDEKSRIAGIPGSNETVTVIVHRLYSLPRRLELAVRRLGYGVLQA